MKKTIYDTTVRALREQGFSCGAIARATGETREAVTKYCQRHKYQPLTKRKNKAENARLISCAYCGKPIIAATPRQKFCSGYCRTREHRGATLYVNWMGDAPSGAFSLDFFANESDELDRENLRKEEALYEL